jgi:hypothetical protein
MASLKEVQAETIATIDTAKAMIDKVLTIMEIMVNMPSLSLTISTNPMKFLLQLLEHVGVTYEDLKAFLTDFLIYVLPALELGVKTILLTNLKTMVSCSIDPRIPEQYRKRHKSPEDRDTPNEYGIDIDIESIDFLDKLSVSPLSKTGRNMYFGQDGVNDVYKFARADDFDAFLWFVMHKGKFPMPSKVSIDGSSFTDNTHGLGSYTVTPTNGTLLNVLKLTSTTESPSNILPGNTFTYDSVSPGVLSMCIDAVRNDKDNIINNTLVPTSDDLTSVNWYIRRKDQLWSNIVGSNFYASRQREYVNGKKRTTGVNMKVKSRDYEKEKAICNLQYIDSAFGDQKLLGVANNKFRFTILPKPYIHIPVIDKEPPWRFIKLRFDANGDYDSNGKYTIVDASEEEEGLHDTIIHVGSTQVLINYKSGKVKVEDKKELMKHLVECYGGLTVYEFNYDYVMGMRLFDAKVLAATLLQSLFNTQVGINLSVSPKHQDATEDIKEIIKSIVNSKDGEIHDCYFTFDNSKYDALLRNAEAKRAKRQTFGNVTKDAGLFDSVNDILSEYDNATDLKDKERTLSRAIQQAAVTISSGSDEEDEYNVQYSFVFDLIENLILAIMNAILSPKVLMLLEVNQRLMGGTWKMLTREDLIKAMSSIIEAMVKEVRDLLIQELLKLLMKHLHPIIELMGSIVVRERLEYYAEVIDNIIKNCPLIWFSFGGGQLLETKLDTVDYADIDLSSPNKNEEPTTNACK